MISADKIFEVIARERFYCFEKKKIYRRRDDLDEDESRNKPFILMERFPEKGRKAQMKLDEFETLKEAETKMEALVREYLIKLMETYEIVEKKHGTGSSVQ